MGRCLYCGSTDISYKINFCWTCCKKYLIEDSLDEEETVVEKVDEKEKATKSKKTKPPVDKD